MYIHSENYSTFVSDKIVDFCLIILPHCVKHVGYMGRTLIPAW